MKLIIAGSRSITVSTILSRAILKSEINMNIVTEIVSGNADGVDSLGEDFARVNAIPLKVFYPDWAKHGRSAGPIRNKQMAEYADVLLLIWDSTSRGSKSMLNEMTGLKKPTFLYSNNNGKWIQYL